MKRKMYWYQGVACGCTCGGGVGLLLYRMMGVPGDLAGLTGVVLFLLVLWFLFNARPYEV